MLTLVRFEHLRLFTLPEHVAQALQHALLSFVLVLLVLPSMLLFLVIFGASSIHLFLCVGGWEGEVCGRGKGVTARP